MLKSLKVGLQIKCAGSARINTFWSWTNTKAKMSPYVVFSQTFLLVHEQFPLLPCVLKLRWQMESAIWNQPSFQIHTKEMISHKDFALTSSNLLFHYVPLVIRVFLFHLFCSICWLYTHNIVKTKPIIVCLQTSQSLPELRVAKVTFHPNPDPFSP